MLLKGNSIVVPYLYHILAGSDFDVDSLFTKHKAYYKDIKGEYKVYGEYSSENEFADKFLNI